MNKVIQEVEEKLQSEVVVLREQERQLRTELKTVAECRKRISAALSALGAKTVRKKRAKNGCTRRDVERAVKSILEEIGQLPAEELKSATKERIAATGKSLSRFGVRFQEVLRSGLVDERQPGLICLSDGDGKLIATV